MRDHDYRVVFIPKIPGKPFLQEFQIKEEAFVALEAIADYTLFLEDVLQLMPDYSSAGWVEEWDGEDWMETEDDA
jgi:hypothetical protein